MTIRQSLEIPARRVALAADIVVPEPAPGVVLLAHGSGSSRHSPRNAYVANQLQRAGLATVNVDLLTNEEERFDVQTREFRFNIRLLAERLVAVTDWTTRHEPTADLHLGLLGAGTGAAAALVAAAARPVTVRAVVSRGGRPDLAGDILRQVHQSTMLIVGARDAFVIELNRRALAQLRGTARLAIVSYASARFAEPGTLSQVARLARVWFIRHLRPAVEQHRRSNPIAAQRSTIAEG
jgi:dienelactone hydrolase